LVSTAALSSLGKWAVLRGRLERNPVDRIVRPKRKDRPPRVPRWNVVEDPTSNGSIFGPRRSSLEAEDETGGGLVRRR
jgi:hypothetical protein